MRPGSRVEKKNECPEEFTVKIRKYTVIRQEMFLFRLISSCFTETADKNCEKKSKESQKLKKKKVLKIILTKFL